MAADTTTEAAPRRTALGALAVFGERRSLVMLGLGFASGLPYLLIFDTLSAWLRTAGLSLEVIAFFSLTTLAYAFKFLWAPLVDRTTIPGLTGLLGHRRSWMLVTQVLIIGFLVSMSTVDPAANLPLMALLAVAVGFSSATQDIVMDGWRIEAVDESRQGAMAAAYQWGYRIAMIVAGALPLVLAQSLGWNFSYGLMAALMLVGSAAVLLAPREKAHLIRPVETGGAPRRPGADLGEWVVRLAVLLTGALLLGSGLAANATMLGQVLGPFLSEASVEALVKAWTARPNGVWLQLGGVIAGMALVAASAWPMPGRPTRPGAYLSQAFGAPLGEFFRRFQGSAGLILALICVYRLADFLLNIMNPFYLDLGFTLTEIAEVRKVFGVAASTVGVFAGGYAVARLGLIRTLLIGAFAQPLSNLVFAWLATRGHDVGALFVAIGVDNSATGFAGTAFIAYLSSLTSAGFTATQYAFFTSIYAIPGKLVASQSGRVVESSARAAETGVFAPLKGLFAGLPPEVLAAGAAKTGVSPAALGAGYVVFFSYTALAGVVAIILTAMVARKPHPDTDEATAAPAAEA
ncbi:MAG: permease [Caulobacter vibrioides]|uniref:Permease n=1 Tax=Caulobacter vibrioides TaxID=155892 RepID=A0A258DFU8_CAUVI|nr:MAG: permease [Caulobacter vibrioides]